MRVVAAASIALSLTATVTTPTFAAVGSTDTRVMSPSSDAQAVNAEARSLRKDVAALLQQYISDYQDRFSDAEVQKLLGYRSDADRKLATVVFTTSQLKSAATRSASPSQVKSAADKALASWSRARSTAESSWASARAIMEPRLSLFEKIGAANDYNSMMDRFDALGERLTRIKAA